MPPSTPPLKVLHFTTTVGGGGAETMLCNVLEAMAESGIESVVVSTTSSLDHYSLRDRIERSARFTDLQVGSLLSLRFITSFWRQVRDEKPDILQTWMHTSGVVAGLIARLAGVRNIVWGIHSRDLLEEDNLRTKLTRVVLGVFSRILPDSIISCSHDGLLNHQKRFGYPASKMIWIGNGIDTDRFVPSPEHRAAWREKLRIPADAPVIGLAGRMNPVKDIPTFLRSAAIAQRELPDAHFVVSGISLGELDPEAAACFADLPDPSRFHWLGFQTAMHTIYPIFDITTLTSTTEAFPMVLIESMACGVLGVSTDVGDARLILGESGRIIPMANPRATVDTWKEILALDEPARAALSDQARHDAITTFSLRTCVARYELLYRQLATSHVSPIPDNPTVTPPLPPAPTA